MSLTGIAGAAGIPQVMVALLPAPPADKVAEYRKRLASQDGFKGHSRAMRRILLVTTIFGFAGWQFMFYVRNFST